MPSFLAKNYQQFALDALTAFFRICHTYTAPKAFALTTDDLYGNPLTYRPLKGFSPDMPYFCLRIPTGGGKTWLAAKAVSLVNLHLLRTEYSVILWLVPSDQIREQTLAGLKDRNHPLHAAIREAGEISVLTLDEAKSVTRATLDTSTTVIVATRQAFQVENENTRKVYANNGALMHHFDGLPAAVLNTLQTRKDEESGDETIPFSLANVLRLRRPFIIVDEAHNSRTELSFDTLARFNPSGIMELTATPDTTKTPSNVLCSVSAAELKAEEMIKLPIVLQTVPDWRQCLADAISRREALQAVADQEWRPGMNRLRPIALIQAEARSADRETVDTQAIKSELLESCRVPPEEVIVATGEEKGLEALAARYPLGLADPACPVKYVITQRALAEGWDCPSAYILVSVASLQSSTAVEQLLGRILRQPDAKRKVQAELNQSYAFVVSRNFAETASALRDQLVMAAGFERKDVRDFVVAANPQQAKLDMEIPARREPIVVSLPQGTTFSGIPKTLAGKVEWDNKANALTITRPLSEDETEAIKSMVSDDRAKAIIEEAANAAARRTVFIQYPAELGYRVLVPQLSMLSLLYPGKREAFDDPAEQLGVEMEITPDDVIPSPEAMSILNMRPGEIGLIDITAEGQISRSFMGEVRQSFDIVYQPENWDDVRHAAWLCEKIQRQSMTHEAKMAFVLGWLSALLRMEGFSLGVCRTLSMYFL
jgi:type III restriction enzyme